MACCLVDHLLCVVRARAPHSGCVPQGGTLDLADGVLSWAGAPAVGATLTCAPPLAGCVPQGGTLDLADGVLSCAGAPAVGVTLTCAPLAGCVPQGETLASGTRGTPWRMEISKKTGKVC